MKFNKKNFFIWIGIFVGLFLLFQFIPNKAHADNAVTISYSDFLNKLNSDQIESVVIRGRNISFNTKNGEMCSTYAPTDPHLVEKLGEHNVKITAVPLEAEMSPILQILYWLPLILLLGLIYLAVRSLQSNGNKALGFGRSRAKAAGEKDIKVTFADVAGIDEARDELQEIVDFLKNPEKFQKLGGKIPRGVLLSGPPGTGKTLLARAIAGEAGVMFFAVSGSEFVEMFVGVGASRVRDMFEQAKKNSPCIVFIDEIDAVGRKRNYGFAGGHEEREQTLNQLLVEMDGFEQNQGIIVIASTNRVDILDRALLRPGRFDRKIGVSFPDIDGREKILKVHTRNVPLNPDVDLRTIARGTPGFSGADLANLINEAALRAARLNATNVAQEDFEAAKDKIIMGAERKSWLLSAEEKELVAYHEAGHAILALYTKGAKPIHKVTIIPRGHALGMVVQLPEKDQLLLSREEILADIMVSMGGRIAEAMTFGYEKTTTGASNDIQQATNAVRNMVMEWGLRLDNTNPNFQNYNVYDDTGYKKAFDLSEESLKKLDQETTEILDYCYQKSKQLLKKKKKELDVLAKSLLQKETLSLEEVKYVVEYKKLPTENDLSYDETLAKDKI